MKIEDLGKVVKLNTYINGIDTHPRTTFTFLGLLVLIAFIFFLHSLSRL